MIETIETRWGVGIRRLYRRGQLPPRHLWVAILSTSRARPYRPPADRADEPVVEARVNLGRWQAECPACGSCQHASEDGWFYCGVCLNEWNGRLLLPELMPSDREAIEALLERRRLPVNRNWLPGETVADLEWENAVAAGFGEAVD